MSNPKIATRSKTGSNTISGVQAELGGTIITDTSAYVGEWSVIYPLEDSVINSITMPDFSGTAGLAAYTLTRPLYGKVTAIQLTSGAVIAYTRTSTMDINV